MQKTDGKGRIVGQERGEYQVLVGDQVYPGAVSGRFHHEALRESDYPCVGDWVELSLEGGRAVITSVEERKSLFLRRQAGSESREQAVASNVDTVLICTSLNGDLNLRRLERYLAAVWNSGARPVIVLTKGDLCAQAEAERDRVSAAAPGVTVVVTSPERGAGELAPYLGAGQTVAFVGSSGVEKSTLINRLLGEDRQSTGGLRDDDRGRHTTTRRSLFALPGGCFVIDTPGMRELGLWDASEGLSRAFADLEELSAGCRFRDCTHQNEPGCAVRAAVERGELDPARLRSYQKLLRENDRAAKEKKFREISRINKKAKR